ncbi:MAG: sulfotransferase family protein, partial [Nocardioidaceae bacterium]|nr:sulfotransferase family protein [Nocardioidaceae bacterium]
MSGLLVLVTGTGRSGTSSVAGMLHHLGVAVPGPYLGANDSNPKGFFESRWAVRFHNDLCKRAGVNIVDNRPGASDLVEAVFTARDRNRLAKFLKDRTTDCTQVVVKDPRI